MTRSVSVIIVTWNALKHLQNYLPSVVDTDYENFEIIIADNASSDGSADWIRQHYPQCRIVTYPRNYGYCGGNNRAVEYASGEILVFLNNDVEVNPGWLSPLVKTFDDPKVAVAQPKIRSWNEQNHFEYAGAAGGYLDKYAYPFCRGRIFDTVEEDLGQYDNPADLFWASGAAFAIRKDRFLEAGRFDELFRFHMEEVDLCWRLLNSGYKIRFSPDSLVFHLGGGSLPMGSARKTYFNFRNSLFMIWKNADTEWLKRRLMIRFCLDGIAGFYALLKGNFSDFTSIIKAHFSFYFHWRTIHRKRLENRKFGISPGRPEEMIDISVVRNYFIDKKRTFGELVGR